MQFEAELITMKVCVVGLGQIGFPVAQYVSEKGLQVYGIDINSTTVENANKTGKIKAFTNWKDVPQSDIYIISVTTGQKNDAPDLTPVFEVSKNIASVSKPDVLVSIESTILPGTSKKILSEIFKGKVHLVHAPHRYWADQSEKYGVNQLRVIGATDPESLKIGLKFYKETLGIPMHAVSSVEVAEMCKIAENSHRYLQIAYAEDLKMLCAKIGMNFDELRNAMNTKWNVDLPEARDGIGRHCLPKDIKYVTSLAPNSSILLESAMNVDKKYREWLTKKH
jgi:UDP-N-acetyl-D-mannosaminuronic acid dehydrogenase